MEMLVAIFIGGMVTVALVTVWKSASMQTIQGQRQSIVRNNLSFFIRQIERDITKTDVLLYPTSVTVSSPILLVGIANGYKDSTKFYPSSNPFITGSNYYYYCYDDDAMKILRGEGMFSESFEIEDFINGLDCDSATVIMDNLKESPTVATSDNQALHIEFDIYKDFEDRTTPISINFNKTVTIGGTI